MSMNPVPDAKPPVGKKINWLSALRSARDRIRNARGTEFHPEPPPPTSNAEIIGAAMRVREEFKGVQESNAQMTQALADFKARRNKMQLASVPAKNFTD